MGIFSDILAPIKDIINGLEKPVEEVEHIFGEVIHITEEIIRNLIDMIKEIEHIFSQDVFEGLFVDPLKDIIKGTVASVEDIAKLLIKFTEISAEDSYDLLKEPLQDAYKILKFSVSEFRRVYADVANMLEDKAISAFDDSLRSVIYIVDSIEDETKLIKSKLEDTLEITFNEGTEITQDFVNFSVKEPVNIFHKITSAGNVVIDDLESVLNSVEKRLKNESEALESMILFLIVIVAIFVILILAALGSGIVLLLFVAIMGITIASYYFF